MSNKINLLPKASIDESLITSQIFECDHLRDVCRVFMQKINTNKENKNPISLLDIGCRDSRVGFFFHNLGYNYIGVDINPTDSRILKGDMHALPFHDESMNVVFSSHALEHSTNIVLALKEMVRVCRADGFIFIATPIHCDYQIFQCDKTHVLVPTLEQMRRLFEYVGIVPISFDLWNVEGQEERFTNLISVGRVVR